MATKKTDETTSESTTPEKPVAHRAVVTGRTISGIPSDIHQSLVASSQLRRREAATYNEIKTLLEKYDSEDSDYEIPADVRRHLENELRVLESDADFDRTARLLLEKYA